MVMSQNREHLYKVLRMLLYEFAFDNNVIIVNLHHTAYLSLKGLCHHSLKGGTYIFQSKRHHHVANNLMLKYKGCLLHIMWVHENLIILSIRIQKRQNFMPKHRIYYLINARQLVTIFRAFFIEISVIYTHPLFIVLLRQDYHISQPSRVMYLLNKVGSQQFLKFLFNDLILKRSFPMSLLLHRSIMWVYIELMIIEPWIYA